MIEFTTAHVLRLIAQAAINIDEGLTTIEAGSPAHRAMHALCTLVQTDEGRENIRKYLDRVEGEASPR